MPAVTRSISLRPVPAGPRSRVAVLVMCHNEAHAVRETLAALRDQWADHPPDVILASNKPSDDTNLVLSEYPFEKLFLDDNYYISALRNAAAAVTDCELLVFLDGHMVLEPGSLQRFVDAFRDERVGAVFGYYSTPQNVGLPWYEYIRDARYHAKSGKAGLAGPRTYGIAGFLLPTGGVFAVRRSALVRFGGFDTGFRRDCFEDVLLGVRLVNAGYRIVYDPGIRASHLHQHANGRALVRRARVNEPRGMVRLLGIAAGEGLRVPHDGYGLVLPLTLLALLGAAAAVGGPVGWALLGLAGVVVARDVVPILRLDPRSYPLRTRIATAAYWYLVNLCRVGYAARALVRRPDTRPAVEFVTGTLTGTDGRSQPVLVTMPGAGQAVPPFPRYLGRLGITCLSLGFPDVWQACRAAAAGARRVYALAITRSRHG